MVSNVHTTRLALIGQISIAGLGVIFFLSFLLFVLPSFPDIVENSGQREWFVVSWNLPGPLMFISVFRIQALRSIMGRVKHENPFNITRWVRFWFVTSLALGIFTLGWLVQYLHLASLSLPLLTLTLATIVLWVVVALSSLGLTFTDLKNSGEKLENALNRERMLLGLTSAVFLIFTSFSTIAMSFPTGG